MKKSKYLKYLSGVAVAVAFTLSPIAKAELVTLPLVGVATDEGGSVLLQFAPGSFNPCGCLVVSGSKPGAKQILATAMLAKSLNLSVAVNRVQGNAGPWNVSDYVTEIRINY